MSRPGKQSSNRSSKARSEGLVLKPIAGLPMRKSMGQHVFEHLKRAIVRGDLSSGVRLVESRIADRLDISRTPVREAIHKLEREGFLKKLPKGGFAVQGLTREDIEETFGIRSVLEGYAAKLATQHHRPRDLELLEKKIDLFQENLDQGRLDRLPKVNTDFHDALYGLSRSPRLIKMISGLGDHVYRYRKIILKKAHLARTSNEDHRRMLRFIEGGDAEAVERLVREHILRGKKAVLAELTKTSEE